MRPHHCDAFNIEHGMEQTSMTNAIKKRLDRKGFTLAEVLVTVAIILILAGVTFVSVVQYQKNLRLMEMDGTAKEIFIAAQNHLSVAQASGDLDRLAEKAKSATGTTDSTIGTKLSSAPSYAGNASGHYYYVIHNVTSGIESCTPAGSGAILQMMLPFGALDETVATGGNYAIVYELKSASVVAVLYSGAGNASFGNAAVINFSDDDVSNINKIYNDKSARKNYVKNGVTAIVGCYTGKAGSAAIPTETLEAPKLEVKNENKLHVIVSDEKPTDTVTLIIRGVQSGTVAQRILKRSTSDGNDGSGTFDVTLDDITGDGSYRFANIISSDRDRFTKTKGDGFIPGENIETCQLHNGLRDTEGIREIHRQQSVRRCERNEGCWKYDGLYPKSASSREPRCQCLGLYSCARKRNDEWQLQGSEHHRGTEKRYHDVLDEYERLRGRKSLRKSSWFSNLWNGAGSYLRSH